MKKQTNNNGHNSPLLACWWAIATDYRFLLKNLIIISIICWLFAGTVESCTIGFALGSVTRDGRPLAFKTRDITSWSLVFENKTPADDFNYACNTYYGYATAWMGVNEHGFGIVQSDAMNIEYEGGTGYSNGSLINYALENCQIVDDFESVLILTDMFGRATMACYAVIDASGGGAIFECSNFSYTRYDAGADGFLVRGNFAYIGDTRRSGLERMERATALIEDAIALDELDAGYI